LPAPRRIHGCLSLDELASADILLSIVPPGEAEALAHHLAPILTRAPEEAVYVDCNGRQPTTVGAIAAIVEPPARPSSTPVSSVDRRDRAQPSRFLPFRREGGEAAVLVEFGLCLQAARWTHWRGSALKMSMAESPRD